MLNRLNNSIFYAKKAYEIINPCEIPTEQAIVNKKVNFDFVFDQAALTHKLQSRAVGSLSDNELLKIMESAPI